MEFKIDSAKKIFIIGAGGLGKEVCCILMEQWGWPSRHGIAFVEEDSFYKERQILGIEVLPLSKIEISGALIVIAIGDSYARERIFSLLPSTAEYAIIVDPSVRLTHYTKLGPGTIVLAHSFISCDVAIGSFAVINPSTSISHDCHAGDYFTTGPGVNISGNCLIGNHVFLGTNSCLRNTITLCDHVIVGLGGVVTKDITRKGTYIGNPAREII